MSKCIHGMTECMWCDALTTTAPETRCNERGSIEGAIDVRCVYPKGHTGKHAVGIDGNPNNIWVWPKDR